MTQVRRATAADVDAVAALEQQIFAGDAWSHASVLEELTGALRQAYVAVDGTDAVCGYVVLLGLGDVADLQRIVVRRSHRRRGVATALLGACDLSGLQRVVLEVRADNHAAREFYHRRGFTEVARRRRYYADGTDALVLELGVAS